MPRKPKPRIALFYCAPNNVGGWITFTVHLLHALRQNGVNVQLYKIGNRTETKERSFGYGEFYRNVDLKTAVGIAKNKPTLITAGSKKFSSEINELIECGSYMVVHDPAEFKYDWNLDNCSQIFAIRPTTEKLCHDRGLPCVFIKHPYFRRSERFSKSERRWAAVSTSRIDFDKNTHILLDANRLLDEEEKIHIYGFENRLYTKFKICPEYPEWEQSKVKYPRELRYAVDNLLKPASMMIDMSTIEGDGGGTQYTFLEAIDAGCTVVVNNGWLISDGTMQARHNCLAVSNGEELAELIRDRRNQKLVRIAKVAYNEILMEHDSHKVGALWKTAIL